MRNIGRRRPTSPLPRPTTVCRRPPRQRYQKLRETGLVAQQDVDNAQGDADAKKAQLESARQNLQRLEQMRSSTASLRHSTAW